PPMTDNTMVFNAIIRAPPDSVSFSAVLLSTGNLHRSSRLLGKDGFLIGKVLLQVEHPKTHQVVYATVDGRCSRMIAIVKRIEQPSCRIPLGLEGSKARPNVHRSTEHPQGEKDLLTEKVCIAFPREPRNDVPQQAISQVGILEAFTRGSHQVTIPPYSL